MTRSALALVAIAVVAACMMELAPRRDVADVPTLEVTNNTGGPVVVYLSGFRVGRVRPGVSCVLLTGARPSGLDVLGFKTQDETVAAPRERFRPGSGWRIRVGPDPRRDVISLRPGSRCR